MHPLARFGLSHRLCSMRPSAQAAKMAVENGGFGFSICDFRFAIFD